MQIEEKESEITLLLEEKEELNQKLVQERSRFSKQQVDLQAAKAKIAEQEAIIAQLQQKDEVELKSAKGIDYKELRALLVAGEWKEADQETARVMLKAANRESEEWLRKEDIDHFPWEDLGTINQLWRHYSKDKFVYSVQKEIYESLGGTKQYSWEFWDTFGDQVGWGTRRLYSLLSRKDL